VTALLAKATDRLVILCLVIHFIRAVAMKPMEFIDLPLLAFTIIASTMELGLHSKKVDRQQKTTEAMCFENCLLKIQFQLSPRFLLEPTLEAAIKLLTFIVTVVGFK
jgi:hypothetical protein